MFTTFSNQVIPEIPKKSSKAEIYLGRLRQMYDLSLINMAFSQRLVIQQTGGKRENGAVTENLASFWAQLVFLLTFKTSEEAGDQKHTEEVF